MAYHQIDLTICSGKGHWDDGHSTTEQYVIWSSYLPRIKRTSRGSNVVGTVSLTTTVNGDGLVPALLHDNFRTAPNPCGEYTAVFLVQSIAFLSILNPKQLGRQEAASLTRSALPNSATNHIKCSALQIVLENAISLCFGCAAKNELKTTQVAVVEPLWHFNLCLLACRLTM